jgi:cell division protein FtsB
MANGHEAGVCDNCGAQLLGTYCHVCGQSTDRRHRSLPHLAWEAAEGLFHLDGRLLRTLPDLFFRPGRLARDYMDHRIARHVPPFRTFLIALVIFIFAAEHGANAVSEANARQQQHEARALATPQGRAVAADRLRLEAAQDRAADLNEAANDRVNDLKDPDDSRAHVEARYAAETARIEARYAEDMDTAGRVAAGLPPRAPTAVPATAKNAWLKIAIRKAAANPDYYLEVLFTWAHRTAFLLLPIVGLSLALVYRDKRQYFIYDHLLVAMNLLSFAFLANAVAFVLPLSLTMWWLVLVAIWTPVNLFQTLRGGYGSTVLGAVLKTFVVWITTVTAFSVLVISLVVFSLTQL